MSILWYDRQGNPMNMDDGAKKLSDMAYKRVAETTLPDGKWVSTVWLGLNHNWDDGPPLIFETMVFQSRENLETVDQDRYATEDDAIIGHQLMVEKYK